VGTDVTVLGLNFYYLNPARNRVMFGERITVPTSVSLDSLKTAVPDGARTGPITVETPGGVATSQRDFVVLLPPVPPPLPPQPSKRWSVLSTAATIISGAGFAAVTSDARTKCDDCDAIHTNLSSTSSEDTQEDHASCMSAYEKRARWEKILVGTTAVSALASAYLWRKYIQKSSQYRDAVNSRGRFGLQPKSDMSGVEVVYRF